MDEVLPPDRVARIEQVLDRYRAGETAVLVVDEAQNLSDEVLEEIRMMTNLETFTVAYDVYAAR